MPNYHYRARDERGRLSGGSLTAATSVEALRSLQTQGLHVLPLAAAEEPRRDERTNRAAKARLEDLATISQQLAIMIRAGVSVTDALSSVIEQARTVSLRV